MSNASDLQYVSSLASAMPQQTGPRKRLGRASRQRRQKLLEIEQAEALMLEQMRNPASSGCNHARCKIEAMENSLLPNDRDLTIQGDHPCALSNRDKAFLTAQLGYVPGNALRVSCRLGDLDLPGVCQNDENKEEPVAIQLYPLVSRKATINKTMNGAKSTKTRKQRTRKRHVSEVTTSVDGTDVAHAGVSVSDNEHDPTAHDDQLLLEPFPTMFWLTHPLLRIMISKLEVSGMGSEIEKRLNGDGSTHEASAGPLDTNANITDNQTLSHLDQMKRAHSAYGQARFQLLTPAHVQLLHDRSWTRALDASRGVAGMAMPNAVKCLHTHAAHFMSRPQDGNVIGKWVMQEITRVLTEKQQAVGELKM
ncbi:hypothetical protein MPSEU_000665600 [Mayamaea pseudoterrestris]|nr:hypothetical protein MPSEU_000665600 [Mayamaea pseudoterrestris]